MKVLAVFLCVAVSSALAGYRGCYKDDGARVMVKSTMNSINDQTTEKCIARCTAMGYPLAGTQWRRECFCGFDCRRLGKRPDSECNLKCTGNQNQNCGGNWRLSVYTTGFAHASFQNAYGTFRLYKNKVNAATAQARCELYGDNWGLADIPHSVVLNQARPGLASMGVPVTTECWIAGKTSKNHHAKLSDSDLLNDSGAQNRIVSNHPNQAQAWNIYSKTGNGARFYICQDFKAEYVGCWRDDGPRVMERSTMESIGNQSGKHCVFRCLEKGYPYAGTQYSRECFCGRDCTRLGEANNCNMNCSGNNKEKCGGSWALSVYKTGLPTPCELIGN